MSEIDEPIVDHRLPVLLAGIMVLVTADSDYVRHRDGIHADARRGFDPVGKIADVAAIAEIVSRIKNFPPETSTSIDWARHDSKAAGS